MTEVRASDSGHLGLFALEDFSAGDVLLEEMAVVKLAPLDEKSSRELLSEWMYGSSKSKQDTIANDRILWTSIKPPPSDLVPDYLHGTFKGMVQAGIVFMKKYQGDIEQTKLEALLQLYYPTKQSTLEAEKSIINVAEEAILFLKQHVTTSKTTGKVFSTFEDWDKLHKLVLIWSCNSFQGGRIYPEISRVNHSCNPNAVIQTSNDTGQSSSDGNNEGQKLLAATKIEKGSEIFISYLGLLLYTDTSVRQNKLERTKFFKCICSRCSAASSEGAMEGAAQIPCPTTHPRDAKHMSLDEDTQYDDSQTVKYTVLIEPGISKANKFGGSDDEKLLKVLHGVRIKVERFLDIYDDRQAENGRSDGEDDDEDEREAIIEEHISLASTMMGNRHWTSNLTLLLHLDRRLKAMSQQMVVSQELPEEEDIAEAIDSLQRIARFVDSLKLDIDPGHLLADVTIGTARMLISLGDEKSQKYGAEWLSKIEEYVNQFSDQGLQKVVSVLKDAWKKHSRPNDDENNNSGKKMKRAKKS
jgi:hypothetical protein